MKVILSLFGTILAGILLFSTPVLAGSCTYPVTDLSWSGSITSGVNLRDKTCMDSSVVASVSGGTSISIIGEADGWYLVKLSDGTKGFVWNTFVTVTSKDSNLNHTVKDETDHKEVTKAEPVLISEKVDTNKVLRDRLKGHILLQVENNGEAWYVHPDDGKRFYMKDGDTAYEMMRSFGLGASTVDIEALLNGDKALASRLSGKIVLAVQLHGEAYYINPSDLSVNYLQNGKEAYRVMRELSLGITNKDLEQISKDDFSPKPHTSDTVSTPDAGSGEIALTAHLVDGAVKLLWNVNGVDTSKGFKVLKSESVNPSYPNDNPVYLSDGNTRKYVKTGLKAGNTYHFRVCNYTGDGCGVYSNDVAVQIDGSTKVEDTGSIAAISLSVTEVDGYAKLSWTITGNAPKGFKVVVSENTNPVYPGDTYHYLSDSQVRTDKWKDLTPGKTYHFRVCEYLGNGCGVYSNDAFVTLDGSVAQSDGVIPAGVNLGELNVYWLNQINDLRADAGLRQLVLDTRWKGTATEWAEYMRDLNQATHNRADGKSMHQWIDTKGLDFTVRHSDGGWVTNYFTENISYGFAPDGTTASVKKVLDDTLEFFLAEASYNGDHYRTIYHTDWNSVGLGFAFKDNGDGTYKVFVSMHYGSLEL
jgi:uncharacterized protein YkwD/uncharacterized protein YgiM (DUF1202 family)